MCRPFENQETAAEPSDRDDGDGAFLNTRSGFEAEARTGGRAGASLRSPAAPQAPVAVSRDRWRRHWQRIAACMPLAPAGSEPILPRHWGRGMHWQRLEWPPPPSCRPRAAAEMVSPTRRLISSAFPPMDPKDPNNETKPVRRRRLIRSRPVDHQLRNANGQSPRRPQPPPRALANQEPALAP